MDPQNWQKISTGDKQAYSQVFSYYYKRLYNYGKKFTDNAPLIEDSIQEIFLNLWQTRHKIPTIHNPQSYFFYAFRNTLFQKLKQEKAKTTLNTNQTSDLQPDPTFNIENILIHHELDQQKRLALEKAIKALPARQREIIFLRFYEGLTYEQIAEIMQITVNSTYKLVSKSLITLRQAVQLPISTIILLLFGHA